jgi:cyclopropane fatty-acyl-phospholipid synthase-like methyltransferase
VSTEQRVREHFEADAPRFDAIYDEEKGRFARFVDDVWRGVVRKRLELALERLAPLEGKSILDVGTGSGRYCLAYAQNGARRTVGIDFAEGMIDLARSHAARLGLEDRCEFIVGPFPEALPPERFEAASAMGFFDYVPNAAELVRAMRERVDSTLIMSFPKRHEWRVPVRRLRFLLMRCPLYLYSADDVRRVLSDAGIGAYDWIDLGRDYVVVARV